MFLEVRLRQMNHVRVFDHQKTNAGSRVSRDKAGTQKNPSRNGILATSYPLQHLQPGNAQTLNRFISFCYFSIFIIDQIELNYVTAKFNAFLNYAKTKGCLN